LQIYTSNHGMHGLGFQEYRQVATAFMEKHLKYNVDDPENSDSMLTIIPPPNACPFAANT
jgi:hypothetical protein